jgi:hypothetical protein
MFTIEQIQELVKECTFSLETSEMVKAVTLSGGLDYTTHYWLQSPSLTKDIYLGCIGCSWEDGTKSLTPKELEECLVEGKPLPTYTGQSTLHQYEDKYLVEMLSNIIHTNWVDEDNVYGLGAIEYPLVINHSSDTLSFYIDEERKEIKYQVKSRKPHYVGLNSKGRELIDGAPITILSPLEEDVYKVYKLVYNLLNGRRVAEVTCTTDPNLGVFTCLKDIDTGLVIEETKWDMDDLFKYLGQS